MQIIANESKDIYIPFRRAWFDVAMMDSGAFHVTLGNSADFWRQLNTNSVMYKTPEILRHYSTSLLHLRRRLSGDVAEMTSDGTIANVLAHVCLNVSSVYPQKFRHSLLTEISR